MQTDLKCKKHSDTKTFKSKDRRTVTIRACQDYSVSHFSPSTHFILGISTSPYTHILKCVHETEQSANSHPKAIHCCINLRSTALRETHTLSPTPFASPQLLLLHLTICQLLGAPSGIVLPGCLASCGRPPKQKKEMVTTRTGEKAEGERECEREGVNDQLWEAIFPLL